MKNVIRSFRNALKLTCELVELLKSQTEILRGNATIAVGKWNMKRSPLKKISKKQVRHNLVYQKAKREYMKANPTCEAKYCGDQATSLHHKKGRGIYLADATTFMSVCEYHHAVIHRNPKWAREQGYMLDRIGI